MSVEIQLTEQFSQAEAALVKATIGSAVEHIGSLLPLSLVKLHVFIDDDQAIPEFGVGGYCENASQIDIALSPGRESDWKTHLPRTIAHEWHHLARWRGPGYGTTLPQVIISEGLAQHFEMDCFPGPPSFYSSYLSDEKRSTILTTFISEFHESAFDHARWFFGKGEFLFQAGYDLSFYVIGKYLADMKSIAANEVALSPEQLLRILPNLRLGAHGKH